MAQGVVSIGFPAGGVVKSFGYQKQPPYTAPDALNVVPKSVYDDRATGGTRPGLIKAFYEELGSGSPIRLLNSVTYIASNVQTYWSDHFSGSALGSVWEQIGTTSLPLVYTDLASVSSTTPVAAARTALSDIDTASEYSVSLAIAPFNGSHHGIYYIYGMMAATTPNPTTNGFVVALEITGSSGTGSMSIKKYIAGVETTVDNGSRSDTPTAVGIFKVTVNGTTVKGYWLGQELASGTVSGLAGTRVGFGMDCTVEAGITFVDEFRVDYYKSSNSNAHFTQLVSSSGGSLYREETVGTMTAVTTDQTLSSDVVLQSAAASQKLYIADVGYRIHANSVTVDDSGIHLHQSLIDWSDYGIDVHDDVAVITNGTGGVVDGTYTIASVASGDDGDLTLSGLGAIGNGSCTVNIHRAPKVYDPILNTLSIWQATAGLGQVPTGCPLICRYRDRLVLGGAADAPSVWYMSRSSDPNDWDYAADADDGSRAVAGTSTVAGDVGDPLTALIPHADDLLLFGCTSSLWVCRGDPAYGGQIDRVSDAVGVLDKHSWCRTPEGETVFLSLDGIYSLAPGVSSWPTRISRERIPADLLNVDKNLYTVSMAYDVRNRGIHIFLAYTGRDTQKHWWLDWSTKTFWPVSVPSAMQPLCMYAHASEDSSRNGVLFGCMDGYIRKPDPASQTDDGTEITSWVMLGPLRLGKIGKEGLVSEIWATLPQASGQVTWGIKPGVTGEEAYSETALATGTWTYGMNYRSHPRVRAASVVIKLENAETNRSWSIEEIGIRVDPAGDVNREQA